MLEYYKEHWYLLLILAVLAAVTVAVWRKALRKRAKANRLRGELKARLDLQKEALESFRAWREDRTQPISDRQLFSGFALDLQSRLQHESEQLAAFAALSADERQLYALFFALEDAPGKLSDFFKGYGKPLTEEALAAVRRFCNPAAAEVFAQVYAACDPDDEESSYIPARLAECDTAFADALNKDELYSRAAAAVRELL
jgi:type II secretory pathway pseudopilin PulG